MLEMSKVFHFRAGGLRSKRDATAESVLATAAQARRKAHAMDMGHIHPAWTGLMVGERTHAQMHDQLMEFYREKGVL